MNEFFRAMQQVAGHIRRSDNEEATGLHEDLQGLSLESGPSEEPGSPESDPDSDGDAVFENFPILGNVRKICK